MGRAFTIREVPDDVARRLKTRVAEAGQSLQADLLSLVTREAAEPTLAEIAARAERYAVREVSTEGILAVIDEGRADR
ncbi:hypothetical protein GCM10009716_18290 [Streptomyces sodiiphilus]|uniref:Antitoxin FitA-like ribbon-helix-helix domain-containing protein n=1 Tax=Streptomyces sodiiphilus TaxID=226217 RepID=A0ABN2P0P8_9ACTN